MHDTRWHGLTIDYDFTGLKCPLPVLKARRALGDKLAGQVVLILVDDPAAPLDFEHFCETAGHQLVKQESADGVFLFHIKKQG